MDITIPQKQTFKLKSEPSCSKEVAEMAECFMNAAKSLHKLHLKISGTGSYAAHSALNGYDAFHGFADDLIENYQGAAEVLLDIPDKTCEKLNTINEALSYLKKVTQEVSALQAKLPYSEIINQLDLVKEHCNSMRYKLKFLQ